MKSRRHVNLLCESLEDRSVPATLVNPTTMTFQDVDGDLAQAIFSQPVLNEFNVNDVFTFDIGSVNGSNTQRQSLKRFDVDSLDVFDTNGLDVTLKVIKKAVRGNGEVHVGEVHSLGQSLGKLDIKGDVGQFHMYRYDGDLKLADTISVNSTGRFDPRGNSLQSALSGFIGSFVVRGDLAGGFGVGFNDNDGDFSKTMIGSMQVWGSVKGSFQTADRIDNVFIRGSIDGAAYPNPEPSSFFIGNFSTGAVGTLTLLGSVIGGSYPGSGQLRVNGSGQSDLGTIYIGGSIRGNSFFSGQVGVAGSYQSVTVNGSLVGGTGEFSGILNPGDAENVYINGSIIGGAGARSGQLINQTFDAPFTNVLENLHIQGSIVGGSGAESGTVHFVNPVNQFQLNGSIRGGNGNSSGSAIFDSGASHTQMQTIIGGVGESSGLLRLLDIYSSPYATNQVFLFGSIRGGAGDYSGGIVVLGSGEVRINGSVIGFTGFTSGYVKFSVDAPTLVESSSLFIRGSLIGHTGVLSGSVVSNAIMDQISIMGSFVGAQGTGSASLQIESHVNSMTLGGSLLGGTGFRSGVVISFTSEVDSIRVHQSIIGGNGQESGSILMDRGDVGQINVTNHVLGGKGNYSGMVKTKSLESLRVGGSVLGGDGELAGGVRVLKRLGTATIGRDLAGKFGYVNVGYYLGDGYLDSISIGGNVKSSAIISTGAIGTINVRGSISGAASSPSYLVSNGAYIPAGTPGQPYLLRSLAVSGSVSFTKILMGNYAYDQLEVARVGNVSISRNWSNSLLVVGYDPGVDGLSGTDDDVLISTGAPSSIDSLFIGGSILGNEASVVQAGLVSQLKLGQNTVNLIPGEFNDDMILSQLLRIREMA